MTTKKEHNKIYKRTRKNKNMSGGGGNRGKKLGFLNRIFKPKQPQQPPTTKQPQTKTIQQERNERIQKMIKNAEEAAANKKGKRNKDSLEQFINQQEQAYAAARRNKIKKDLRNYADKLEAKGGNPRFA